MAGHFDECNESAIYVYKIKIHNNSAQGLVLCTDIQDLLDGKILFHEDTISKKEKSMVKSMLALKILMKPVLMFHKKSKKISKFIKDTISNDEKYYDCELAEDHIHSFWKIKDHKKIKYLQDVFDKDIRKAYVADGHHRIRTNKRLFENHANQFPEHDFTNILSAYFSLDQVKIYDHVKIVKILDELDPNLFIEKISKYAKMKRKKTFQLPSKIHDFVLIINGEIFNVQWRKKTLNKFRRTSSLLDVNIMDKLVFKKILGIPDIRKDNRLVYFSGNSTAKEILDHCLEINNSIAIIQYPLSIKDIMREAKNQKKLPPKSTWFEPKIKSGVIGHKY
jgi:uncharacterized protein (DUF1015 family)